VLTVEDHFERGLERRGRGDLLGGLPRGAMRKIAVAVAAAARIERARVDERRVIVAIAATAGRRGEAVVVGVFAAARELDALRVRAAQRVARLVAAGAVVAVADRATDAVIAVAVFLAG